MKKIFISIYIMSFLFIGAFSAQAANLKDAFSTTDTGALGVMAGKAGYEITENKNFLDYLSLGIQTLLSVLGVVFLVLLIYGGFLWMTARGNDQQVEESKEVIFSSVIGLIIVLSAYAVSYFVIKNLTSGVLSPSSI